MATYRVKHGDCLSSIAFKNGFFWETLWNHSENSSLKEQRQDPNALFKGDMVFLPEKEEKEENGATAQKHTFRLKGAPVKMKVQILDDDEPKKNAQYRLYIDGRLHKEGQTDANGFLEASIRPNVRKGEIVFIDSEGNEERISFDFGTVDPIDTDEGVLGRLASLGYTVDDLSRAIREFQEKEGLTVTGTADAATRDKLKEKFGE